MKPIERFLKMPKSFWASVRALSQHIGYSKQGELIVPSIAQMVHAFAKMDLDITKLFDNGSATALGLELHDYFETRAKLLKNSVEPNLMDAARAKRLFTKLKSELKPNCPLPMNKQKGEKKAEAFLTGIVNMLIEKSAGDMNCDYDPRELTTITRDGEPLRTLARRVDGAFPSTVNPVAIWEIKEYFYTTTFGSRVADGVYESLLDGIELEELREHEGIDVHMVDLRQTLSVPHHRHAPYGLCRRSFLRRRGRPRTTKGRRGVAGFGAQTRQTGPS